MWKYFLMKKHWTNSLLFNHKYQSLWRLAAYCLDGAVFAGPDQLCELCTLCWRKLLCVVCCFLKPAYNKNKTSRSWNVSYVSFKHTDSYIFFTLSGVFHRVVYWEPFFCIAFFKCSCIVTWIRDGRTKSYSQILNYHFYFNFFKLKSFNTVSGIFIFLYVMIV